MEMHEKGIQLNAEAAPATVCVDERTNHCIIMKNDMGRVLVG